MNNTNLNRLPTIDGETLMSKPLQPLYKNYGKERCTSHAIGWKTLNQLVLEDIRLNAQAAKLAAKDYMDMLIAAKTQTRQAEIQRYKRDLKRVDMRITELTKILAKLYEDLALEKSARSGIRPWLQTMNGSRPS
ncbi:MAG: hypothetical protein K2M42_02855 [Oscillospiraceae bacterium]|nr:hypothetical protein [Oscillospiraceae bacterium]